MKGAAVRKRCQKCGTVSMVKPREVRCKRVEPMFGGTQRYCWGLLAPAPMNRAKAPKGDPLAAKLALFHVEQERAMGKLKRAVSAVSRWQKRIKDVQRQIERRDAQAATPMRLSRVVHLPEE